MCQGFGLGKKYKTAEHFFGSFFSLKLVEYKNKAGR